METIEVCELNVDTNGWQYMKTVPEGKVIPRSLRFIHSNICSQGAGHISQISCEAFMIVGLESLFKCCRSQDVCQCDIWLKP